MNTKKIHQHILAHLMGIIAECATILLVFLITVSDFTIYTSLIIAFGSTSLAAYSFSYWFTYNKNRTMLKRALMLITYFFILLLTAFFIFALTFPKVPIGQG